MKPERIFVSALSVKRFRSLTDTKVSFSDGLNIVIGNNGSGKSNMLTALFSAHQLAEFPGSIGYEYSLDLTKGDDVYMLNGSTSLERANGKAEFLLVNYEFSLFRNNEKVIDKAGNHSSPLLYLISRNLYPRCLPIRFENWKDCPLLGQTLNAELKKPYPLVSIEKVDLPEVSPSLLPYLIAQMNEHLSPLFEKPSDNIDRSFFENLFSEILEKQQNLIDYLKQFTSVRDIRFSPNFYFRWDAVQKSLSLAGLVLEFQQTDGGWYLFRQLSDGTQRLIHIISQFCIDRSFTILHFSDFVTYKMNDDVNVGEIILLEEPELGIHPHQLHKLMTFIKEQSEEKQIILTTHSPQVLNVLGPDELDRIIICEYDNEKGTQLRHMTDAEMDFARTYMKKQFLSDFWLYSGFNDEN